MQAQFCPRVLIDLQYRQNDASAFVSIVIIVSSMSGSEDLTVDNAYLLCE